MKKGTVVFLILLIIFLPIMVSSLNAKEQEEVLNATNGNEYLKFQEYERVFYVRGLMDAVYAIFQAFNPEIYQKYEDKMKDMTVLQLTKILDKYLEENPEKLHYSAAVSFLYAIDEIIFD